MILIKAKNKEIFCHCKNQQAVDDVCGRKEECHYESFTER